MAAAGSVFDKIVGFVFALAAAKLYGKEAFGVYLIAWGAFVVAGSLASLGLGRGIVRFAALFFRGAVEAAAFGAGASLFSRSTSSLNRITSAESCAYESRTCPLNTRCRESASLMNTWQLLRKAHFASTTS